MMFPIHLKGADVQKKNKKTDNMHGNINLQKRIIIGSQKMSLLFITCKICIVTQIALKCISTTPYNDFFSGRCYTLICIGLSNIYSAVMFDIR